eukprot:GFUD01050299.1.p1 GENE.GFUD01050299.1~~GFUD01050299.1.p1  ORF type:complete len:245 (-),score=79.11 GFUD01050299.1:90-824(-)
MGSREKDQTGSLMVRVLDQDLKEIDLIVVEEFVHCDTSHKDRAINTSTITSLLPSQASLFSHLLNSSSSYRDSVLNFWTSPSLPRLLTIHITNNTTLYMDYTGCRMAQSLLWEMIELEDALHWLSTLGGAFSNLGEHNPQFAVRAGTNAMKQLVVSLRCGDQTVVMKCWLFIGQSLTQQGQFCQAARVVRWVWRCCHQPPLALVSCTSKLLNMCRGVWARLRHERGRGKMSVKRVTGSGDDGEQ